MGPGTIWRRIHRFRPAPIWRAIIGTSDPRLIKVLPEEAFFQHTFWLAAHADRLRLKRVRVVWDYLRSLAGAHRRLFLHGEE